VSREERGGMEKEEERMIRFFAFFFLSFLFLFLFFFCFFFFPFLSSYFFFLSLYPSLLSPPFSFLSLPFSPFSLLSLLLLFLVYDCFNFTSATISHCEVQEGGAFFYTSSEERSLMQVSFSSCLIQWNVGEMRGGRVCCTQTR
jgi:hypothetical protein